MCLWVVKPGSLQRDDSGEILEARSTVTLIESGPTHILVDSGLAGEEKAILSGLDKIGIVPEDIQILVNTHQHSDHTGNNHLFTSARWLHGADLDGLGIAPGVRIAATPGHTMDSISVVCHSSIRSVIAGDALPTMDNFLKDLPPRIHVDRRLAMESLHRIANMADLVVPGHDHPFSIPERNYVTLEGLGRAVHAEGSRRGRM
ncbi:MAG: MBL fold metallo-hydrolase [Methanotrichaceae archaeon]|nr:MBL fold metallo-hydrolase [Methanotrichaceae archaeon]